MQDREKRVVRDIIPGHRLSMLRDVPRQAPSHAHVRPKGKRKFLGLILTFLIIFVGITVIAVALSLLYSKAVVTITPKIANFEIKGTFTAKKDILIDGITVSNLLYRVVTEHDSDHKIITAADGPLIQTKAKGTMTLYNEQAVQQKILAGTRLANLQGLIYRTTATVTIPAKKTVAGSIAVGTIADQAGANYNMSLATSVETMKVVAYKGSAKYASVYGKIKTDMSGGFFGNKKIISPETQKLVTQSLKEALVAKLIGKIKAQVQKGDIFYDNAYTIEYEIPELTSKDKDTADIVVKGTMYGAVFKKDSLMKLIAKKELDKFPSKMYETKGMEDLTFSIINARDFSAKKGTPLVFILTGPVTVTGIFSQEILKNELKGTYLKESNAIYARYPSISNADAFISPFWMRYFPNSVEKITIEMKN